MPPSATPLSSHSSHIMSDCGVAAPDPVQEGSEDAAVLNKAACLHVWLNTPLLLRLPQSSAVSFLSLSKRSSCPASSKKGKLYFSFMPQHILCVCQENTPAWSTARLSPASDVRMALLSSSTVEREKEFDILPTVLCPEPDGWLNSIGCRACEAFICMGHDAAVAACFFEYYSAPERG